MRRIRHLIADPEEKSSIGTSLRAKRWKQFARQFPEIAGMHVVDLGGTVKHWEISPLRPASVVVLNLLPEKSDLDWVIPVQGDACNPPDPARQGKFDLVYSNSVIEHVGGHSRRCEFAAIVHDMAPHHWVQTPYRYFPIEPHWLFPGLQFLPQYIRARAIRYWPLSPTRLDAQQSVSDVLEIELLSKTEMHYYFPNSNILHERVLGLTKSIIAVA